MTPNTVPALQRRVAELEQALSTKVEQLAFYKGEVRTQTNRTAEAVLQVTYRLPPLHARYTYLLYLQRGRPLTHATALEALYKNDVEWPDPKVFAVMVCYLRKQLGPSSIRTVPTLGYCMSAAQIETIDKLLNVEDAGPVYALNAGDTMPPLKPREHHVTYRALLLFKDGQQRTAQDLAAGMGWEHSRAFVQIGHMRRNGLITPTQKLANKRMAYLITPVGRTWLEERSGDGEDD